METKRCKKCACIYPAYDFRCPSCGSMRGTIRKKVSINNAEIRDTIPVVTQLIEIQEKTPSLLKLFTIALLLGRFSILWAFFQANKVPVKEARFAVEYQSGRECFETVLVDSSRYQELLKYSI